MNASQLLTAVRTRSSGWQTSLQRWGSRLNNHEQWLASIFAANPPTPSDSNDAKSGTGALGAISLDTAVTKFTTTGAATATLADGYEGQLKTLHLAVDGGDLVVTPANLRAGTTITLNDINDLVVLQFVSDEWSVIANTGAVVA